MSTDINTLYNSAGRRFLRQEVDWESDDIRLFLMTSDYIFDGAHTIGNDLGPNIVANEIIPSRTTTADSKADAFPIEFAGLTSGRGVESAVVAVWQGSEATSWLLAYYGDVDGFPFTPIGGVYTMIVDEIFGGLFQLGGPPCP